MGGGEFSFTNLINIAHWNEARWRGVLFAVDQTGDGPPLLGFLFENRAGGLKIFDDWLHRFGGEDAANEIRVAIIKGDIPGKDSGYSVTVGSDVEGILNRHNESGQNIDGRYLATISRCHRMNPRPGSPFLGAFKEAYKLRGEYLLVPAFGTEFAPEPDIDHAIRKSKIIFRNVKDVVEGDRDKLIFH